MADSSDVFVVTLQLDATTFEWLQALRSRYFPPERNLVPAHLTLFHAESGSQVCRLKKAWSQEFPWRPFAVRFMGLRSLGKGIAVVVESSRLHALRSQMIEVMAGVFCRQDQQAFRPHVTIQNRVDIQAAKALLEQLSESFVEREGTARGLMIWRYLGGPWSRDAVLPFKD